MNIFTELQTNEIIQGMLVFLVIVVLTVISFKINDYILTNNKKNFTRNNKNHNNSTERPPIE